MAAFWRSDSVGNSTHLLQHLHQIRDNKNVGQAASAFVCQLIAGACSCGKQPVISLHSLLVEVIALCLTLPACCANMHGKALHSVRLCAHLTPLHCTVLLYWIALNSNLTQGHQPSALWDIMLPHCFAIEKLESILLSTWICWHHDGHHGYLFHTTCGCYLEKLSRPAHVPVSPLCLMSLYS